MPRKLKKYRVILTYPQMNFINFYGRMFIMNRDDIKRRLAETGRSKETLAMFEKTTQGHRNIMKAIRKAFSEKVLEE